MSISRVSVHGLLLLTLLLWLPSGARAQGTMLSVMGCRAGADELFEKAKDLSIDDKVINDELAKFKRKCETREAGSIERLPRYRKQVKAQKEEEDRSLDHVEKSATKYQQIN